MANLKDYDAVIDVRSPDEFALDHLPGAINLPVLSNEERAQVGTINAQQSSFDANRIGAALISRNIAQLLDTQLADKPRHWQALIYCWRGGNRSGSLATVLARIGFRIQVLDGGYRSYRRWVIDALGALSEQQFRVIGGRTGTGKSRILRALNELGAQVLDLEALANHRGSVLGLLPQTRQPSQKLFDTRLRIALAQLDPNRPVFVESESRKIGQIQIPESLINRIRSSPCHIIDMPVAARANFLLNDYPHFVDQPDLLVDHLEKLNALHGGKTIEHWTSLIRSQQWQSFVQDMLSNHYDPSYDQSMRRNFALLDEANRIAINAPSPGTAEFTQAARDILALSG